MPGETIDILVVDDKAGVRRLICEALLDDGYLVEQASNGAEAIQKIKQKRYKLVLLDVKMPGMNGLETLHELRKIDRHVPVAMMTAYGELELVEEARNNGVRHHISKPFDLNELRALVRGIINEGSRGNTLQLG